MTESSAKKPPSPLMAPSSVTGSRYETTIETVLTEAAFTHEALPALEAVPEAVARGPVTYEQLSASMGSPEGLRLAPTSTSVQRNVSSSWTKTPPDSNTRGISNRGASEGVVAPSPAANVRRSKSEPRATSHHTPPRARHRLGEWDYSWSEEFHSLLAQLAQLRKNPSLSAHDDYSLEIFDRLRKLSTDFLYVAETWGRMIIEEVHLSDDLKTIKPHADLQGVAGGAKYLVHGIMFKFQHKLSCGPDKVQLYASEDEGSKVSGHELRASAAVCHIAMSEPEIAILPPLMGCVDFRGYRLLAVSVLNISKNTLVYGSDNTAASVHNSHTAFAHAVRKLGQKFNLAPHTVGEVEVITGVDCEGHVNPETNEMYLVDLARLFPSEGRSRLKSEQERIVQCEIELPLEPQPSNSKFFTSLNSSYLLPDRFDDDNDEESEADKERDIFCHGGFSTREAWVKRDEDLLEKEREGLEGRQLLNKEENRYLFRLLRPNMVTLSAVPLSSDAASNFGSSELGHQTHKDDLNRFSELGLRTKYVNQAAIYLAHRPQDSVGWPVTFSLASFLHERGINVRFLGLIYVRMGDNETTWRPIIVQEMVARAFKSLLRRRWRAVTQSRVEFGRPPSEEDFQTETVRYLNRLIVQVESENDANAPPPLDRGMSKLYSGKGRATSRLLFGGIAVTPRESLNFWTRIAEEIRDKFGVVVNGVTPLPEIFLHPIQLRASAQTNAHLLLKRVIECTGLELEGVGAAEGPITNESLRTLHPTVKHLNLIKFCEAKVAELVALRTHDPTLARAMLERAKTRIEQVVREAPFKSSDLLADVADISYELGIRTDPIRSLIQDQAFALRFDDVALRNLLKAESAYREIDMRHSAKRTAGESGVLPAEIDGVSFETERRFAKMDKISRVSHAKRWALVTPSVVRPFAGSLEAERAHLPGFDVLHETHTLILTRDLLLSAGSEGVMVLNRRVLFPGTAAPWWSCGAIDRGAALADAESEREAATTELDRLSFWSAKRSDTSRRVRSCALDRTGRTMFIGFDEENLVHGYPLIAEDDVNNLSAFGSDEGCRNYTTRFVCPEEIDGRPGRGVNQLLICASHWDPVTGEPMGDDSSFYVMAELGRLVNSQHENVEVKLVFGALKCGAIAVWQTDAPSPSQPLRVLEGHVDSVRSLASFKQTLISCGKDGSLRVWKWTSSPLSFVAVRALVPSGGPRRPVELHDVSLTETSIRSTAPSSTWVRAISRMRANSRRDRATPALDDEDDEEEAESTGASSWVSSATSKSPPLEATGTKKVLRAASAGADGKIRVWDVDSGELVQTLVGHAGRVTSVHFVEKSARRHDNNSKASPGTSAADDDSVVLFSGGEDSTVRVWHVGFGVCLRVLALHSGPVTCVRYDMEKQQLFSLGANGVVRAWKFDRFTVVGLSTLASKGNLAHAATSDGPVERPLTTQRSRSGRLKTIAAGLWG